MSRNKLSDKLVIIDLEATCDEPKPEWQSEIIEIGVCLLDLKTLEVEKPRGIMVMPKKSPITSFCTKLTTITMDMLEKEAVSLKAAMDILVDEYKIHKRAWGSWGDYDRKMLLKDCLAKGIDFPGESRTHQNIKNIIATQMGWNEETGLDKALDLYNMSLEGTHHRGVDDAKNIARIYSLHIKALRRHIQDFI